jgi:hypothetical protein
MKIFRHRALAAAAMALALAGCGGAISIGIGGDFGDFDDPPRVSLVAGSTTVAPGQTVRFAAAAADDGRVDQVSLHRVEPDGRTTLLATDTSAPYEFDVSFPAGSSGTWRFFARAIDDAGQSRDSELVSIRVG